jgi:hypothetical protein
LKRLATYLSILFIICLSWKAEAQTLTYTFVDPCTKSITNFSVPAQGTTIFFLSKSRQFTQADVQNGILASWVNQVYTDYRKVAPCGQQQGQITQNQITSQIIGSTVQSVVGSIMGQAQSAGSSISLNSESSSTKVQNKSNSNVSNKIKGSREFQIESKSSTVNDAASKNKKDESKKKANRNNNKTTTNNTNSSSNNSNNSNADDTNNSDNSGNNTVSSNGSNNKTEKKEQEVSATTIMNVDAQNQKSEIGGDNSGKKSGKSNRKAGNSNPILVSSDFTTAQNLNRSFTPILNLSMSQSSMTGMSSWGVTSMIWFNFKQFAISGKYSKIQFSQNGKLKWVHNLNLTGVYSYGNFIGFLGYSGILNAGKYGVTGFNTSISTTKINGESENTFISPSITAFYTKPFTSGKKFTISPELYIISTPIIYSTKERITISDRTFSAFLGSGFDYQISRRFKLNMNYKLNVSTNKDFPILSFFLIGSKVNL